MSVWSPSKSLHARCLSSRYTICFRGPICTVRKQIISMWGGDTEACCAVDSRHRSLEGFDVERDRFSVSKPEGDTVSLGSVRLESVQDEREREREERVSRSIIAIA
ncbi:hypothetical protein [Natronosalvus rutilus]|uniref:Uncharacterized protein n=1 Tax=Natronosalvus rutilus TaxID=2953753 RepID=A0A9E7N7C5_9EURY|nr:hypothetical protein [Natronosalvus rutilus]UTF52845.1 hypothetical protein NGM29_13795 [Natronosalvus rutilus]